MSISKIVAQFVVAFILCFSVTAQAQKISRSEQKGNKAFRVYDYAQAIALYNEVDSLSAIGRRNLAKAYQFSAKPDSALNLYNELIALETVTAEDYFMLAQTLKMKERYEESQLYMVKFNELNEKDKRGQYHVNARDYAKVLKENSKNIKIIKLGINSSEEDFSPAYYKDQVVFASSRFKLKAISRKWNGTGLPFIDMYLANVTDDGKLDSVQEFKTDFNSKFHDGPASFSADGKLMVFTRNNYDDRSGDGTKKLQMFYSRLTTEGKWEKATPFSFNSSEYSTGHPSVAPDGKTIYFACDKPGGFGGADIYKTILADTGWTAPQNMDSLINTEGDELFPFYHDNSKAIYFASNGHVGLGGLDILAFQLGGNDLPVNLGYPLNTNYDDFGLIMNKGQKGGFISSNRANGLGYDDIYGFEINEPVFIKKYFVGLTQNEEGEQVPDALVYLYQDSALLDSTRSDSLGYFTFNVEPKTVYSLNGSKEQYLPGDTMFNTDVQEDTVKAVITLKRLKVGQDLAKILKINPIYFDLNKYNIRADAAKELDKIVKAMTEYPDMVVELGSHTDCRASESYNRRLSDRRAKASARYVKERISNPDRIYGKGYGESKLVNDCACEGSVKADCSEEEHQKNRRTEFVIIKM